MEHESYIAALDYLRRFTNYERKMTEVYAPEKMDPDRPRRLLALLGNPHERFPSVHIAGTKGKGSVSAMCATALRAAGLNVGLYTSPHLQEFRERIRILTPDDADGRISPEEVAALVQRLQEVEGTISGLTWFELVTALAFMHFADAGVDIAVIEVGLGGRLDATNVVTPLVSVITSLSLDHTGLLGHTVAAIAREKAGIIKPNVPVVSADQPAEALAEINAVAAECNAPVTVVGRDWRYRGETWLDADSRCEAQSITVVTAPDTNGLPVPRSFSLALAGQHQQENAVVALATLAHLQPRFRGLTFAALRDGLANVQWPGRLQRLSGPPGTAPVLLDGAHNADSAVKLARYLSSSCQHEQLWLIIGILADKNMTSILQALLPLADHVMVTQSDHPRATPVTTLQNATEAQGRVARAYPDVGAAVGAAWAEASSEDLILVTGSLSIVGDLLNCWEGLKSGVTSAG